MRFPEDPGRQAMLVAALIWGIDGPMILAPTMLAGSLSAKALVQALTIVAGGWLLSIAISHVILKLEGSRRSVPATGLAVAAAALTLGAVDAAVTNLIAPGLSRETLLARGVSNTIFVAWMFVLFTCIVLLLASNRRIADREADLARADHRAAQAGAAATAARLAALRYQLNPHFLFNTLNAVSSAVVTRRNAEAESMLARLADFLRATLSGDPTVEVRLEEELGTVEAYLEIETERFRHRLAPQIDCPPQLRGALVPSFILQPLVENVIKHGVSLSRSRVHLKLSVCSSEGDLFVIVEDDARPVHVRTAQHGTGIGHSAVTERLKVLYGDRGVLQAQRLPVGFRVEVRLPLRFETCGRREAV